MKPTVFFSHSSRNRKVLSQIKDLFLEKIGGTVDVFLSSDGQSIPLGSNWVHSIEESLEESKLMFVFLTPDSIKSDWIYFEAGYAHSKGIKVIPVGLPGVHLENLNPPISLLQGFNITSTESLNNLIAVINKEFDFNHQAEFTDDEYKSIFQSNYSDGTILSYFRLFIDNISIDLGDRFYYNNDSEKLLSQISDHFEDNELEYQSTDRAVSTHGINLQLTNIINGGLAINLDPTILSETSSIFENAIQAIKEDGFKDVRISLRFSKSVNSLTTKEKITARFLNSDISLEKEGPYSYKDTKFKFSFSTNYVDGYKRNKLSSIIFLSQIEDFPINQLRDVIEFLFDSEILFVE